MASNAAFALAARTYDRSLFATITYVQRRTGMTLRAIRYYEEHGLVAVARGPCGVRSYNPAAVERLDFIAQARRMDLSLFEIRELLAIGERAGAEARQRRLAEICAAHLTAVEARATRLRAAILGLSADDIPEPLPGRPRGRPRLGRA